MSHALTSTQMSVLFDAKRLPTLAAIAVTFAVVVTKWDTNRRTRQHLRDLPPHLLKDIGCDPMTAAHEASKPFWRS